MGGAHDVNVNDDDCVIDNILIMLMIMTTMAFDATMMSIVICFV